MIAKRSYIFSALAFTGVIILSGLAGDPPATAKEPTPIEDKPVVVESVGEDPAEPELIEAALLDQGYLSDAVPLTYDEQALLRAACEEFNVPYALAVAVIEDETHFSNVIGDGGDSFGYMQIQPRWHAESMSALGVTDLMDPCGNFRVGCAFLGELLQKYDPEDALSMYNHWATGSSTYSREVLPLYEKWQSILN